MNDAAMVAEMRLDAPWAPWDTIDATARRHPTHCHHIDAAIIIVLAGYGEPMGEDALVRSVGAYVRHIEGKLDVRESADHWTGPVAT